MSFKPIKFLEESPVVAFDKVPAALQDHYKTTVDFIRTSHNKQREIGFGMEYDAADRVSVPLWFLWMFT